jgi:hypothetical protein
MKLAAGADFWIEHFEDGIMSTRRKAYWWFWFVASGRFLETFLNLRGKRS